MQTPSLFETSGATFSPQRRYRYRLWRRWGPAEPLVVVMLNPSTADEHVDDPTVARMVKRAQLGGYGGLEVGNLFAFRATDPRDLLAAENPVGPENDAHLVELGRLTGRVLCAWGVHGAHRGRADVVRQALRSAGVATYVLRFNLDGSPAHPLYLPLRLEPIPW